MPSLSVAKELRALPTRHPLRREAATCTRGPDRLSALPDAILAEVCAGLDSRELVGAVQLASCRLYTHVRRPGGLVHMRATSCANAVRQLPARRWVELCSFRCGEGEEKANGLTVADGRRCRGWAELAELLPNLGPRLRVLDLAKMQLAMPYEYHEMVATGLSAVWPALRELHYGIGDYYCEYPGSGSGSGSGNGSSDGGGCGTSFPALLPTLERLDVQINCALSPLYAARHLCHGLDVLAATTPGRLRELSLLLLRSASVLVGEALRSHAPHLEALKLHFRGYGLSHGVAPDNRPCALPPLPNAHTIVLVGRAVPDVTEVHLGAAPHPKLRRLVCEGRILLRAPGNAASGKVVTPCSLSAAAGATDAPVEATADGAAPRKNRRAAEARAEREQESAREQWRRTVPPPSTPKASVTGEDGGLPAVEPAPPVVGAPVTARWQAPALQELSFDRTRPAFVQDALAVPGGHGRFESVCIGPTALTGHPWRDGFKYIVHEVGQLARHTARELGVRYEGALDVDTCAASALADLFTWPQLEVVWLVVKALPPDLWWASLCPQLPLGLRAVCVALIVDGNGDGDTHADDDDNASGATGGRPPALPTRIEWRRATTIPKAARAAEGLVYRGTVMQVAVQ